MSEMIRVTLPDGSAREVARGTTSADIAAAIGPGLAKAAIAARVDGELRDIMRPIEADAQLALVTNRDEADALELARHDFAHILAEAVQTLFPGTQITFGPSTDDGFYYDVMAPASRGPFTMDDLPAIEEQMRVIIRADKPLRREVMARDTLIATWQNAGESFKAEWAAELPDGEELSVYWSGDDWMDMCRGPHLASTGKLDPQAFKLTRVSGAYWRGDQNNAQLSRVYGTGWLNKKQLDAHLTRLEEAAKRDHRRLGAEMDLFHLQSEAHGSVFWHPNGWTIYTELQDYMRRQQKRGGYVEVNTPQVVNRHLWEKSGHWANYQENMFIVEVEEEHAKQKTVNALKPMNCPCHVQIFNVGLKSYRELPLRMAEFGSCNRYEPSGALHGIMRVRGFTQDDAHIFCREDQIESESKKFIEFLSNVYRDLGFNAFKIKFSTRPEKRAGDDATWDKSEGALANATSAAGYDFTINPGEGAFYGPKLEFVLTDAIGRDWQCGTLQVDFVLPERLDAVYIGEDGAKHRPVMLHRATLGSFERFIGILIESHAGKLPFWLAPRQVVVASIVSDADDYCEEVAALLLDAGVRAEVDLRNEKINYKVREHSVGKVPVILAIGAREVAERTVTLRRLGETQTRTVALDEIVSALAVEATPPDLL